MCLFELLLSGEYCCLCGGHRFAVLDCTGAHAEEVTEPVQARGFGTEPGAAAYRYNKLASPIWRRLATASCIWTSVRVLDRAIAAYEASMALAASLNSLKASGCRE